MTNANGAMFGGAIDSDVLQRLEDVERRVRALEGELKRDRDIFRAEIARLEKEIALHTHDEGGVEVWNG